MRRKNLMKGQNCIALLCAMFGDHTVSISPLGALGCVVRVLMHFYFWSTEGTLVPVNHCDLKLPFLFHVFTMSKHLSALCQVSDHAFS